MHLTPKETDKLMLHYAGDLAKKRKERGIKLNYVEALALLSMEIMELAREGNKSVAELMSYGREILKTEDGLDGVAYMLHEVQVEATFPDGTKLVTIHNPIQDNGKLKPGEYILKDEDILLNVNKECISLKVSNQGDRPIQVGSHFHFFEVNRYLKFDRQKAFGRRLNIASGTSVRFEPGEVKNVELIEFGGKKKIIGFNDLTNGVINQENEQKAIKIAQKQNFAE